MFLTTKKNDQNLNESYLQGPKTYFNQKYTYFFYFFQINKKHIIFLGENSYIYNFFSDMLILKLIKTLKDNNNDNRK